MTKTHLRHVGVIMDGNGRWATGKGLPKAAGHRAGVVSLRAIVRAADDIGLVSLTVYAMSTENFARPRAEVSALMRLLIAFLKSELKDLHANNVRIRILGDGSSGGDKVLEAIQGAVETTQNNTGLTLNIAFGYGSRAELLRAAQNLAAKVQQGRDPQSLTADELEAELYTAGQPELDLIIRTGGDMRLSNFLLYQAAYAELWFTPTLWPDFAPEEFTQIMQAVGGRKRTFGLREETP